MGTIKIGAIAALGIALAASLGAILPTGARPVPAVQAEKAALRVGDIVPRAKAAIVTEPGFYGLGRDVPGSRYAIVEGKLVRLDAKNFRILSVLRQEAAASR